VWVASVALLGLPGHCGCFVPGGAPGPKGCGGRAFGMIGWAVSISTCLISLGVSRSKPGSLPLSRRLSPADCTIARIPAWKGVAPEVVYSPPEKTLWVP